MVHGFSLKPAGISDTPILDNSPLPLQSTQQPPPTVASHYLVWKKGGIFNCLKLSSLLSDRQTLAHMPKMKMLCKVVGATPLGRGIHTWAACHCLISDERNRCLLVRHQMSVFCCCSSSKYHTSIQYYIKASGFKSFKVATWNPTKLKFDGIVVLPAEVEVPGFILEWISTDALGNNGIRVYCSARGAALLFNWLLKCLSIKETLNHLRKKDKESKPCWSSKHEHRNQLRPALPLLLHHVPWKHCLYYSIPQDKLA